VRQLAGGILAWQQAGLPVEKDAKAPIDVMRQVQITAGSLVMLGVALGWFVSPWFFILSAFVGAGLAVAGITNTCGMAMMLSKMPWNRRTT
jgi:rhodanese-related sulfurtransferase